MPVKQTLLEMTQEILESMESDVVTSITDTAEATAVARMIRRTYWDLFGIMDLPENYQLFHLGDASLSNPTLMSIPTNVMKIEWIKYNQTFEVGDLLLRDCQQMNFKDFIDWNTQLFETDNISGFNKQFISGDDNTRIRYFNDRAPQFWASPDDSSILFDAVNTDVETYLTSENSLGWGLVDTSFTFSDSFVPNLDASQFSLLFNESKALAFAELKQTQNAKAEQRSRRLMISAQHKKRRAGNDDTLAWLPNYGRKGPR